MRSGADASTRALGRRLRLDVLHEHGSSLVVTALSSAFGVMLLSLTRVLIELIADAQIQSESLTVILSFIVLVFLVVAVYVGAVVTANTFATIVAGRARTIALLRLIGRARARNAGRWCARDC